MSVTQPQSDLRYRMPSCQSAGYLARFGRYIRRMLSVRCLISELSCLDDHLLIDIGIEDRHEVPQFARRVVMNNPSAEDDV